MKPRSYKLKVNKPILFAVAISVLVVLAVVTYLQFASIEKRKMMVAPNFQEILKNDLKRDRKVFDSFLKIVKKDKDLQKIFLSKDREKLYKKIKPVFDNLNKNIDLTHLYFLDENGKTFLRVHNPKYHSDTINRFTFKEAYKSGKPFSGLEFGIKKNFTLRSVHPWVVEGKIIGYIEMGKEIDKIMTDISKLLNVEIYMAIDKNFYMSLSNKEYDKNIYETHNHLIVYSTNIIPKEIDIIVEKDFDVDLRISQDEEYYHTSSLPVFDVSKKKLGYFIFLVNATFEISLLITNMLITIASLIVIGILFFLSARYLGSCREKEINDMANKLVELAITDELTNLYNRKHFNEHVPLQINSAKRLDMSITMIMFDVDYFKRYNDTYGHQAGDTALKEISRVTKSTFQRSNDACFRIGGEEFAVVIIHQPNDDLFQRAESLREAVLGLNIEHSGNDGVGILSISIGMITCHCHASYSLDSLYKKADDALYSAKDNGRNRIEIYQTE